MTIAMEDDAPPPSSRRARRLAVGCASAALAVLAAACGGGAPSASPKAGTTTSTAPPLAAGSVIVNGQTVTVPTEANGAQITPNIATGQNVVFTKKGFLPAWLFAATGQPITFTNLSSSPVTIRCVPLSQPAFTIQPGKSFSFVPTAGIDQFEYITSQGFHGKAQVGVFDN